MQVNAGSFGLFLGLSVINSTAASFLISLPTTTTVLTTFYHFCPHLTPKRFAVNEKLDSC